MAEIENLKIGANGTIHIVGNENIITEEWEASKTYVKDKSYVIREHKLYVCNVTHTSTNPFDPTKWTEITVIGAIDNALEMTAEASGAIATFESEYALPLRDLEIEINAVQEAGTPTPSSPKAITGFTGANITNAGGSNLFVGVTLSDGYIKPDGTTAGSSASKYSDYIEVVGGSTALFKYTYTGADTAVRNIAFYDNSNTFISYVSYEQNDVNVPLAIPNNAKYVRITVNKYNTLNELYDLSTTTAISWNDEAGTVYGGSLDVTTGVLTVTHFGKLITDTSSILDASTGTVGFRASVAISASLKPPADNQEGYDDQKSNVATYVGNAGSIGSNLGTNSFKTHTNGNIYFYLVGYNTLADLKTYAQDMITANTPIAFVWKLATPQTYQLTPTQISAIVGTNNVFTDTNGDTSLEYYTKRGEQTVRIAEGVVNNDDFNTLNTTSKKITGAINELYADKFDSANRVSTGSGTFAGLLNTGDHVWLIIAQRLSTNSTIVLVAHKQGASYYFKEIVKDTGMAYNYNQDNGSVVITYGGQTTGVYGGAYRLI